MAASFGARVHVIKASRKPSCDCQSVWPQARAHTNGQRMEGQMQRWIFMEAARRWMQMDIDIDGWKGG